MKEITKIVCALILLGALSMFAQEVSNPKEYSRIISIADKFLVDGDYFSASQEYLKATKFKENDGYADMKLAESYRLNMDYYDAEKWYDRCVVFYRAKFPKLVFWLADVQKTNGKYNDAIVNYAAFIKTFKPSGDEDKKLIVQANTEYKGCFFALDQLDKPTKEINIKLLPFPVNTKNSEFSPVIFYHDSAIVITSARADSKGLEQNLATGETRTDNFRYEKKRDRWLRTDNHDNFDIVNTSNDDGAGQFNRKTNKYYYTICDPECGIYVSRKIQDKFTKSEKLNANINDGYWNAQPTITTNADTMFFVSKRDGGRGSNDIWMSINKDKSGTKEDWGTAKNLFTINTSGTEISPFWDPTTKNLYFASNGMIGLGGLDIYKTNIFKLDSTVNMGLPYNSNMDDYYFTMGKDKGYIVSNRYGGIGQGDIYSFDRYAKEAVVGFIPIIENPTETESISSVGKLFYVDSQAPTPNTSVYLKDEQGVMIKEAITNANGEFRFENLAPDKNFKIIINSNDPRIRAKIDYFVNKQGKLQGQITYNKSNQLQESAKGKKNNSTKETVVQEETITVLNSTLLTSTKSVENIDQPISKKQSSNKTLKNKTATPTQVVKYFKTKFENVYYDFNSVEIPQNGKIVLNNLIVYLKNNPKAQVEIKAFTDGLGNSKYNLKLAMERGKACFDYLATNGVDQSALIIIPVGASQPLGANNTYIGRQLNRRVQFDLVGTTNIYVQNTMIYIVEPKMGLQSIAQKFDMTLDELKLLNGIDDIGIKAYSPLRVKRVNDYIIAPQTMESLKMGNPEFKFENMQFVPLD